jgi:hypothetical protein
MPHQDFNSESQEGSDAVKGLNGPSMIAVTFMSPWLAQDLFDMGLVLRFSVFQGSSPAGGRHFRTV